MRWREQNISKWSIWGKVYKNFRSDFANLNFKYKFYSYKNCIDKKKKLLLVIYVHQSSEY